MNRGDDDLERLFRGLVEALGARGAHRLAAPIQVSEIYQTIIPYRTHRDQLGFESNQDYEMAVLRLLAGEHGLATLDSPEAQEALAAEAGSVNPDTTAYRQFAAASLRLNQVRVRDVLQANEAYAPPAPPAEEAPEVPASEPRAGPFALEVDAEPEIPDLPPEPLAPVRPSKATTAPTCRSCGRALPLHREIVYCPFCGRPAGTPTCAACGEELEPGWRFCVTCGAPFGRGNA